MLQIDWDKAEKLSSEEKQELLFYLFKIFTTEIIISEYSLEDIPINLHHLFCKHDEYEILNKDDYPKCDQDGWNYKRDKE